MDSFSCNKTEKIDLFPFLRAFFSVDGSWDVLSDSAKQSHNFMLFQFLSIKRPEYIQFFNMKHIQMNVHIMNALHNSFKTANYPGWMYTKTTNLAVDKSLDKYPSEIMQEFLNAHQIEQKDFAFLYEHYKDDVTKQLDEQLAAWKQTIKKTKND